MMESKYMSMFRLGWLIFASVFMCVPALAELQVIPSRIVLSEAQKTGQISLVLKAAQSTKYRINAVTFKMNKDGSLEEVKDPTKAENSAIDYFRYSPRQVTVESGTEQVVRLQLKLPEDATVVVPEGDYHAQISIEAIEESDESTAVRPAANPQAMPRDPPVRIPIVVRKGNPELKLTIENFNITMSKDGGLAYEVDVIKKGSAILHADFMVLHLADGAEKPTVISQANGVSSFIERRTVAENFSVSTISKGKLTLEVRETLADGAKVLATATIETTGLPKLPIPSREPSAIP